jgi:hypothetical protein
MKSSERPIQVDSYFKNGELFVEIEDEINLNDFSSEELSSAVKEGVRIAINELFNKE